MRDELDRVMQRTQAYWFVDGLSEMATGVILGLVALLFAIDALVPDGSPWEAVSSLGLTPVILLGGLLAGRIVTAIKRRITYPRTGYVTYPRMRGRRLVVALISALIAVVVGLLAVVTGFLQSALIIWQGVVVGAFLWYWAYTLDLRRFYTLTTFSVMAAGVISLTGVDETLGDALYFGVMALALLLSGALTLRAYLRDAPPAAQTEDDAE